MEKLPPDLAPEMSASIAGRQHLRTFYKETASLSDTLTQIASLDALGNLPVTVIRSEKWLDADSTTASKRAEWNMKRQRHWLTISANSHFLIIPGTDHMSLLLVPEHAAAVANPIVQMIVSVRDKRRSHVTGAMA